MIKLTLEQIEQFLDSKQDDAVIGRGCDPHGCLVANALSSLYPSLLWSVGTLDAYGLVDMDMEDRVEDDEILHFSDEIADLIIKFDTVAGESPVTKAEWRAACSK